jgi:hypothetical protein
MINVIFICCVLKYVCSLKVKHSISMVLGISKIAEFGFNTDGKVIVSIDHIVQSLYVFAVKNEDFPTVFSFVNYSQVSCRNYILSIQVYELHNMIL